MKKSKLTHLVYDFIKNKGSCSLREVFLEFEKSIEPDRATRTYNHTVRRVDRGRAQKRDLEHRIFHGKKRIVSKTITGLIKQGVLEQSANSKNPWDRVYKPTSKPYRGRNDNVQVVEADIKPQETISEEPETISEEPEPKTSKDTHLKISLPILSLPGESED